VVGQGLDSLIFYPLAFYGLAGWPPEQLFQVVLSQWAIKTGWEAVLTPVTYLVVNTLKRREGAEVFDTDTNFSPFGKSADTDRA
jgi:queuosine precursor transporter